MSVTHGMAAAPKTECDGGRGGRRLSGRPRFSSP